MSPTTTYTSKPARAETEVNLANERVLRIVTAKDHAGYLVTRATVVTVQGNSFVFVMFEDFNEEIVRATVRTTDSNVRRQHEDVLANVAQWTLCAVQFYTARDAKNHASIAGSDHSDHSDHSARD